MARQVRKLDDFKKNALSVAAQQTVKGGYKFSPSGANFSGSFIWEGIDIRGDQQILKYERHETASGRQESLGLPRGR
jgi:hypothetical protein